MKRFLLLAFLLLTVDMWLVACTAPPSATDTHSATNTTHPRDRQEFAQNKSHGVHQDHKQLESKVQKSINRMPINQKPASEGMRQTELQAEIAANSLIIGAEKKLQQQRKDNAATTSS